MRIQDATTKQIFFGPDKGSAEGRKAAEFAIPPKFEAELRRLEAEVLNRTASDTSDTIEARKSIVGIFDVIERLPSSNKAASKTLTVLKKDLDGAPRKKQVLHAHDELMKLDQRTFDEVAKRLHPNLIAKYITGLFDATETPYLGGVQSLELNKFWKKLDRGGPGSAMGDVSLKLRIASRLEYLAHGDRRSPVGSAHALIPNSTNDLQTA